jgi:hypothetical protein
MSSYNEQMQELASQYQAATGEIRFRSADVGAWAIAHGLWQPSPDAILKQFSTDLSRALREEYIRDPQGRRVRAKHAIREDGTQGRLWADIHTASREHMDVAFQQRREQIVADCVQLRTDVDSYNENQNSDGEPLQLGLDFTVDVEEYILGAGL